MFLFGILLFNHSSSYNKPFSITDQTKATFDSSVLTSAKTKLFTHVVHSNETLEHILPRYSSSKIAFKDYCNTLTSSGFSKLYLGDSLIIKTDSTNTFLSCSILNNLTYWYHIAHNQDNNNLYIAKKLVDTTKHILIAKIQVSSNIKADIAALGLPPTIFDKLYEIFSWQLNLATDAQNGDSLAFIFEQLFKEGHSIGYGNIHSAKYTLTEGICYYAIGLEVQKNSFYYYDQAGTSLHKKFLISPIKNNYYISSYYAPHRKHPIFGVPQPHLGVDFSAPVGTPIYATSDGIVKSTAFDGAYGKQIHIFHGASYKTSYNHLHTICDYIKAGYRVTKGQMIGTVGVTGRATGPHVHYSIQKNNQYIDPLSIQKNFSPTLSPIQKMELVETKLGYDALFNQRYDQKCCYLVRIQNPTTFHETTIKKTSLLGKKRNGRSPHS